MTVALNIDYESLLREKRIKQPLTVLTELKVSQNYIPLS